MTSTFILRLPAHPVVKAPTAETEKIRQVADLPDLLMFWCPHHDSNMGKSGLGSARDIGKGPDTDRL